MYVINKNTLPSLTCTFQGGEFHCMGIGAAVYIQVLSLLQTPLSKTGRLGLSFSHLSSQRSVTESRCPISNWARVSQSPGSSTNITWNAVKTLISDPLPRFCLSGQGQTCVDSLHPPTPGPGPRLGGGGVQAPEHRDRTRLSHSAFVFGY